MALGDWNLNARKLLTLMSPPTAPLFTGSNESWREAEAQLTITLPNDYKWFISHYGKGLIGNQLRILNPFTPKKVCRLDFSPDAAAGRFLTILREQRTGDQAEDYPYPPFPAPRGLLPCGASETVTLYWLVDGIADNWKIVVELLGPTKFTVFDETLISFLEGIISGHIECDGFSNFAGKSRVPFVITL